MHLPNPVAMVLLNLSPKKAIETKNESSLFRMLRNFRHQPWIPALVSEKKGNYVAKLFKTRM